MQSLFVTSSSLSAPINGISNRTIPKPQMTKSFGNSGLIMTKMAVQTSSKRTMNSNITMKASKSGQNND